MSALAVALLTACGGDGDGDGDRPQPPNPGQTTFTVTPSVNGGGGSISPSTPVSVNSGGATAFTLRANSGYNVSGVGGTCGGTLSGTTYTTHAITANCTVVATFVSDQQPPSPTSGSVPACFSAPTTVSYALKVTPPDPEQPNRVTIGPSTYNGQAAVRERSFHPSGATSDTFVSVTNSSATVLGMVVTPVDAPQMTYVYNPLPVYPANMQPGQMVEEKYTFNIAGIGGISGTVRSTFVGFETITLAGRTFAHACHFRRQATTAGAPLIDVWIAPGYGQVKTVEHPTTFSAGNTMEYAGNL